MPRPSTTVNNFWDNVSRGHPDQCWPWNGAVNERGYGRIDFLGHKGIYAHRIAYVLANPGSTEFRGPIDQSSPYFVRHFCDNPPCCNPKHLLLGTHDDNMKDKVARGRSKLFGSLDSPRAKLSADDVRWMRIQKNNGATKKSLSLLYEVSEATVSGACYGRHYTDVLQ